MIMKNVKIWGSLSVTKDGGFKFIPAKELQKL